MALYLIFGNCASKNYKPTTNARETACVCVCVCGFEFRERVQCPVASCFVFV
jgi:hypothetical protein